MTDPSTAAPTPADLDRSREIGSDTASGTGTVRLGQGTGSEAIGVFPLCLGGNVFGWTADEKASFAILDAFVEAGGNFVDTADVYSAWVEEHSGGESETVLGAWLTKRRASGSMHVATKTGKLPGADLSRESVTASLDASLARLGTGSVSLYYAHRDEEERDVAEIVATFGGLVADGRVRTWGLSNWSAERIDAAVAAADAAGLPRPAALQNQGSAVERTPVAEVEAADRAGILQLPWGALASGFLTGKYRRGADAPKSERADAVAQRYANDAGWTVLDAVRGVAEGRGVAVSTVAIAWLRSQGTVPVASASKAHQLGALVTGAITELSADEVAAITTAG